MNLNWSKSSDGLIPAIVQDAESDRVLMLGYMNRESFEATRQSGRVTFFSRSRQSIWVKGETSGNFLDVVELLPDCDQDAILIRAKPAGATCHRGTPSCFDLSDSLSFLEELEAVIEKRLKDRPESSYVARLASRGLDRIAQKVGEEAIETVIAAKNPEIDVFESEAADLVFHLMVLLKTRGSSMNRLSRVLKGRHEEKTATISEL